MEKFNIDLDLEGNKFKMNGTMQDIEKAVEKLGGRNLKIYDSRSGHFDKIIHFDTSNGFHVSGHATKR